MFSWFADILTGIFSILLPIFASYKALRTSDPANLAPWLMYWTTLSLVLLAEGQLYFIFSWLPFYAWFRLFLHLYLVLPGQQGSVFIYKQYIHPFLEEHERQIDRMISDAHARAKEAGLDVFKQAFEYVRINVLGQAPKEASPVPSRNVSYSTYLMDRFTMPSARQGLGVAGSTDVFSMIGKALQQTTYPDSTSRDAKVEDLTRSGTLIPPNLSDEDRNDFISTQRDRLTTLLRAFDQEASGPGSPQPPSPMYDVEERAPSYTSSRSAMPRQPSSRKSYLAPEASGMHKSRSESEFEDLAYEPMPDPEHYRPKSGHRKSGGGGGGGGGQAGWSNWIWGSYGEKDSAIDPRKDR